MFITTFPANQCLTRRVHREQQQSREESPGRVTRLAESLARAVGAGMRPAASCGVLPRAALPSESLSASLLSAGADAVCHTESGATVSATAAPCRRHARTASRAPRVGQAGRSASEHFSDIVQAACAPRRAARVRPW